MTARVKEWAALGALLAVTFWVHLAQFGALLEWDSNIFMVAATQILRYGLLPYRDLWELKPPAVFYYLAGVMTVLPDALWSVRFVDFALYLGGAYAFYRCCRYETSRLVALLGAAVWLYVGHHGTFNLGGLYTEEYAAIGGIVAVSAAVRYASTGRGWWALASGLAVAAAALFKHPGATALVPAFILLTRRPRLLAYALLFLGAMVPVGLVVAYFWMQGALRDFLECNVWALVVHGRLRQVDQAFLVTRLQGLATASWALLAPFPVLTASLLAGVPFALLRPSWLRVAALLWVMLDFVGVAAQRQFAQHHFILTFPSTCLLGTLAMGWLVPRSTHPWYAVLPRVAACVLVLWFALPGLQTIWRQRLPVVQGQWAVLWSGPSAWPRRPTRGFEARIGAYVGQRTTPTDRIHVQGYGPGTLGIYWAAERPVATRYFYEVPYPYDQAKALAELRKSKPTYVIVTGHPPFLFLQPWLESDYTIETVKWHDYRADVWVRNQPASFSAGTLVNLSTAPELGGLTLPPMSQASAGFPAPLPEPRRGRWTSPVVPVRADDQKVHIDWNPRADLAWNPAGREFPQVEATRTDAENDVRVVLGVPTKRGYWTGWPHRDEQAVTVWFGFPAVIDQIDLLSGKLASAGAADCDPALVESMTPGDGGEETFRTVDGEWSAGDKGVYSIRFPPRVARAVRLRVRVSSCGTIGGLRRVRVRAAGMGTIIRYRTGTGPELDDVPWYQLSNSDELSQISAGRWVQVQYELWSQYADVTPVLRAAQVGHLHFTLDAGSESL